MGVRGAQSLRLLSVVGHTCRPATQTPVSEVFRCGREFGRPIFGPGVTKVAVAAVEFVVVAVISRSLSCSRAACSCCERGHRCGSRSSWVEVAVHCGRRGTLSLQVSWRVVVVVDGSRATWLPWVVVVGHSCRGRCRGATREPHRGPMSRAVAASLLLALAVELVVGVIVSVAGGPVPANRSAGD